MIKFSQQSAESSSASRQHLTRRLRSGRQLPFIPNSEAPNPENLPLISAKKFYGTARRRVTSAAGHSGGRKHRKSSPEHQKRENSCGRLRSGNLLNINSSTDNAVLTKKSRSRVNSNSSSCNGDSTSENSASSRSGRNLSSYGRRPDRESYKSKAFVKRKIKAIASRKRQLLNKFDISEECSLPRSPRIAGLVARAKLKHFLSSPFSPRPKKKASSGESDILASSSSTASENIDTVSGSSTVLPSPSVSFQEKNSELGRTGTVSKFSTSKRKLECDDPPVKYMMTRRQRRRLAVESGQKVNVETDALSSPESTCWPVFSVSSEAESPSQSSENFDNGITKNDSPILSYTNSTSDDDTRDSGCLCPDSPELMSSELGSLLTSCSNNEGAEGSSEAHLKGADETLCTPLKTVNFNACDLSPMSFRTFRVHCPQRSICESTCSKNEVCIHTSLQMKRETLQDQNSISASPLCVSNGLQPMLEASEFAASSSSSNNQSSLLLPESPSCVIGKNNSEDIAIECTLDPEISSEVVIVIDEARGNSGIKTQESVSNCDSNKDSNSTNVNSLTLENTIAVSSSMDVIELSSCENEIVERSSNSPSADMPADTIALSSTDVATVSNLIELPADNLQFEEETFNLAIDDCDVDVQTFSSLIENVNLDQLSQNYSNILPTVDTVSGNSQQESTGSPEVFSPIDTNRQSTQVTSELSSSGHVTSDVLISNEVTSRSADTERPSASSSVRISRPDSATELGSSRSQVSESSAELPSVSRSMARNEVDARVNRNEVLASTSSTVGSSSRSRRLPTVSSFEASSRVPTSSSATTNSNDPTYDRFWPSHSTSSDYTSSTGSYNYPQNTGLYSNYPSMSSSSSYPWQQNSYWLSEQGSWMGQSYFATTSNQPWYSNQNQLWPTLSTNSWSSSWNRFGSASQSNREVSTFFL